MKAESLKMLLIDVGRKPTRRIRFSPDGRFLAIQRSYDNVELLDIDSQRIFTRCAGHFWHDFAIAPNCQLLALSEWRLVHVRSTSQLSKVLLEVKCRGACCCFSHSSDKLFVFENRKSLCFETTTLMQIEEFRIRWPSPAKLRGPIGRVFASKESDQFLAFFEPISPSQDYNDLYSCFPFDLKLHPKHLGRIPNRHCRKSVSPDWQFVANWSGPTIRVSRLSPFEETALRVGPKHFQSVRFSPDSQILAAINNNGNVYFWECSSWRLIRTFHWGIGRLLDLAFAPDGLRAAAGGEGGQIVVWDVDG